MTNPEVPERVWIRNKLGTGVLGNTYVQTEPPIDAEWFAEFVPADLHEARVAELEAKLSQEAGYKTLHDAAQLIIELRDARIAELEAEVKRLRERLWVKGQQQHRQRPVCGCNQRGCEICHPGDR